MKLKILPTHLRDKTRYLAFQAISEIPLERDDIISLVSEESKDLYGAYGASKLGIWVVKVWNYPSPGKNMVKGIIRCNREEINAARAIMPTVTRFRGKRVVFQTLGISGTIKAAITKFIKLNAADD
ncbi:Rpp14/Pop5 family protein [Methanobacterium petrolearium]|uniref:Rpp14/Pop5 family protein n=1 Tax=Methanobacterium petrolearium TaxID=710190 RepID=UPI001AE3C608|nr:Rpp14/Pop5 family protein [Methanobacterium petrolearium]MBP1946075.1 ribonuclease P/MRP protein subunit POP5 [Methanobacterium petrolearium]BDZ70789.1 ribonuclease P protein component 2 [Methanobacterium petrolearium]